MITLSFDDPPEPWEQLTPEQWTAATIEHVARRYPAIRSLAYPKELRAPPGYFSSALLSTLAYSLAEGVTIMSDPQDDLTLCTGHVTLTQLIRYQVPTFFARAELCDALLHTEPPTDLMVSDLVFPMPAMLFMLPTEFTMRYVNRVVPFIAVATVPPQHSCDSPILIDGRPTKGFRLANAKPLFFIYSQVFEPDGVPSNYDLRCPVDHPLGDLMLKEITYYNMFYHKVSDADRPLDALINQKLTSLAVNLMLAMMARPELITREHILKPAKKDGKKVIRRALWRPNFIGDTFRIVREGDGVSSNHASPHAHWRKGHWRNQAYGPGHTLRKLKLIEAVFVGLKKT